MVSSTPLPKTARQPRMRASCDGCFLAKVKCTKNKPICNRCLSCGLECQYSPSTRMGKPKPDPQIHGRQRDVAQDGGYGLYILHPQPTAQQQPLGEMLSMKTEWNSPSPGVDSGIGRDNSSTGLALGGFTGASGEQNSLPDQKELFASALQWQSNMSHGTTSNGNLAATTRAGTMSATPDPAKNSGLQWPSNGYQVTNFGDNFGPISPVPGDRTLSQASQAFNFAMPDPAWSNPSTSAPNSSNLEAVQISTGSHLAPLLLHQPMNTNPFNLSCISSASGRASTCFESCLNILQALHDVSPGPDIDILVQLSGLASEECALMLSCPCCMNKSGLSTSTMVLANLMQRFGSIYDTVAALYSDPINQADPGQYSEGHELNGEQDREKKLEDVLQAGLKLSYTLAKLQEYIYGEPHGCPGYVKSLLTHVGVELCPAVETLHSVVSRSMAVSSQIPN
ncbi:hypothetical protein GGR52DRAFT_123168 [Hypoxylon sp. FL1284]|nr:hypothetical protein GGR52DRAFT_123168 [Hypoxylon sp. FL1284]